MTGRPVTPGQCKRGWLMHNHSIPETHPHIFAPSRKPRKVYCANKDGRRADIYTEDGRAICSRCFCALLDAKGGPTC